ncbi:RNA-dependent RNA polymerase [Aphalara polygoni bunya-like virus]|uniref:RNA-directed RNA polymerase L n=1 Tax=Aphalara polygoni bunya-like virus TaxID=2984167 RepID=A0A9N6YK18_9VIRU|nr:RNA-dependent RNA polymerase [Aphalara polygoni bunya-like virus]DAZ90970.1 TPA_asm: RNA-dependent RNA polymerase [Aphalara polygoni bunya-like virus]
MEVINEILLKLDRNCVQTGLLYETDGVAFSQTRSLRIPELEENAIEVDVSQQLITMTWDSMPDDELSASSIVQENRKTMTFDKARTFIHDFTFETISPITDVKFSSKFPLYDDTFDGNTPDVIVRTPGLCLVLEFTTTQNTGVHALQFAYQEKLFKYSLPIRNRITVDTTVKNTTKYGYFPIAVNPTCLMTSATVDPAQELVNELCARMRFASAIIMQAKSKGAVIVEDKQLQLKSDIMMMIKNIKPKYQQDGECIIPLTKERMTSEPGETPQYVLRQAKKMYEQEVRKSLNKVKYNEIRVDYNEAMREYRDNCLKVGKKFRVDHKSVLQVPNCLPTSTGTWSPETYSSSDPYESFICQCLEETNTFQWKSELSKAEHIELAMREGTSVEEKRIETERRKYKRVKVRLNGEQRVEFGKLGMQGKSMKSHIEVYVYKDDHSLPFDPDVHTDDIDTFIMRDEARNMVGLPRSLELSKTLLAHSTMDHGHFDGDHFGNFIKAAKPYELFHWTSFLSDIGTELCISLKQNVGHDEFIVKKLPNWDCYLIIKPTVSSSHIFYTVVVPRDSVDVTNDGIAKTMQVGENFSYTHWMSFDLGKLTNLVKAESFFLTMLSQWSRYYEMEVQDHHTNPLVLNMLKVSLLVHLEDKSKTEEIMTLFRYISMEKFSMTKVDNRKMLEKLPTVLWSRLQAWAVKRMVLVMSDASYVSEIEEVQTQTGSQKGKRWVNMINPYTRTLVDQPKQLVELYYVGYATNKDAKTWENAEFHLIEKIIKYEMELDNVRPEFCGLKEEPEGDYRFHEWSRNMVFAAADSIKRLLKGQYTGAYMRKLEDNILFRLQRLTWEQVATLKASSTFEPELGKEKDKATGKHSTKRIKVIIAVMRAQGLLKDTPVLTLPYILENLSEEGGLRVDIFRKNQHGGLREIYVLDLISRVLQLCLEEISRAICSELPIEMMMHPESKIRKPQEHMYTAAVSDSPYKSNISSSNDAKVWNQGHHVAKFGQFLCRLLPQEWHGLIVNGLTFWTSKKIALPDGVLNLISKMDSTQFYNPIHQLIGDAYKGIKQVRWMRPQSCYITIESGMMQGILHYTSSLFHCGLLMLRDGLWRYLAREMGIHSSTTDMVSSDDSSRMTDIFCSTPEQYKRAKIFARADHMAIDGISKYFGVWMSPKSTMCCNGIMEFNSEFFFRASLYRPTLKWSYACLNIVEVESLVERQEVMYNLVTELLEGGAGFRQAFESQIAMGFLHYRLMGITVNPLSQDYFTKLLQIPDPSLGYFLMDCPLAAGLGGFSYNLWVRIQRFPILSNLYQNLLAQGEITTTTTGQLTRGVQTRFGDRVKVMNIVEECERSIPDWRERIESDPHVLYSVPRNLTHAMLKIMVKLTSPSVTRALSKGNSIARMLGSAVYLISGFSTNIGSNWNAIIREKDGREVKKTSLWRLLHIDLVHQRSLDDMQERALFPHKDYFIHLRNLLNSISHFRLAKFGSRKMFRSNVQVFPDGVTLPFTLEQMVRYKWFSENLPASKKVLNVVWEEYKRVYTWLEGSAKETLDNRDCHFESHIQMRNFIARQETRSRLVHLTGVPVRDSKTRDVLFESIIRNQLMGHTLIDGDEQATREVPLEVKLYSHIACLVNFPLNFRTKNGWVEEALHNAVELWDGTSMRVSTRRAKLGVIQRFVNNTWATGRMTTLEKTNFDELVTRSRMGVIGGFKRVQRKAGPTGKENIWSGKAEWFGSVGGTPVVLTMEDNTLTHITTQSIDKLRENELLLKNLLQEFGVDSTITQCSILTAKVFYDLKMFKTDSRGAPVQEAKDLIYHMGEESGTFRLQCSNTHVRLQQSQYGGPYFTIISHQIKPYDFNFSQRIEQRHDLIDKWVNNESEDSDVILGMLSKLSENRPLMSIDLDDFKEFARDGLIPSLTRNGWRFGKTFRMGTPVTMDTENSENILENPLNNVEIQAHADVDIFSGLEEAALDIDEDVEGALANEVQFELHDALLGEFEVTPYHGVSGNIRSVHRFWDDYSRTMFKNLSGRSRDNLQGGYVDGENGVFASQLELLLGWQFIPKPMEQRSTGERLARVLEEM